MTTLREAATQALEALKQIGDWDITADQATAIAVLKVALAEPVEPVAWRWGYRSITTGEMDWRGYVEIAAHPNLRSPEIIMQPLYAAPPQRPPLTDEEILRRVHTDVGWVNPGDIDNSDWISFARAIEQAHGIGSKT